MRIDVCVPNSQCAVRVKSPEAIIQVTFVELMLYNKKTCCLHGLNPFILNCILVHISIHKSADCHRNIPNTVCAGSITLVQNIILDCVTAVYTGKASPIRNHLKYGI